MVTVILSRLLGGAALAASGSLVTITDAQRDNASLDSEGALKVTGPTRDTFHVRVRR